MTNDQIRLAAIEAAKLEHADAVMEDPSKGRITGEKIKGSDACNTAGAVFSFKDNGLNRKFVISVSITSIDPDWKAKDSKDVAPDNGCEDELARYQKLIKKRLKEIHDDIR